MLCSSYTLDPNGIIQTWNPGVSRILGYSEEEFIGQPGGIIFTPEDRRDKAPEEELARAEKNGTAGDFRWHLRKDGTRFWGEGFVVSLRKNDGFLQGFAKIMQDKTEQKLTEERVYESEQKFRQLAENISEVFWFKSVESTSVLYVSPAFEKVWGRDLKEVTTDTHKVFHESIIPEDQEKAAKFWADHLKGEPVFCEYRILRPDGEIRWIYDQAFPIKDSSGKLYRIAGIATDITNRKRVEESLRDAMHSAESKVKELRDDVKLREQTIALVSHDLRNPIGTAKMAFDILLDQVDLPPEAEEMASIVFRSFHRAEGLLLNLLDTSRLKAGEKIFLNIEHCNLCQITTNVVKDLGPVFGDRFRVEGKDIHGYWSPSHVARMIDNLATNAVKYGSPDSPVTISLFQDEKNTTIRVHNLGTSIPSEQQAKLFDIHVRASNTSNGWGIGLAYVRGAAEAHGGRVEVESSPEKGTTFTVTLPNDARETQ